MRRDVYIQNDSGGFSVIAHDALDAIIEDQRDNDFGFVTSFKALLLMLHGDDSMPVRIVVDEPLQRDEEEQWLAKATWRIDSTDGRLLVMGGFDPDVMSWWRDETEGERDGKGVALVEVPEGSLRVDVYAHVGSMNGRHLLGEAVDKLGAAFRKSHPGRPFPLWLAQRLDYDDEDPGFDEQWKNVKQSVASGALAIDTEGGAAIGFVVHVQKLSAAVGNPPDGGWFDIETGSRTPASFPVGLASSVSDPNIEAFLDKILGREKPSEPPAIVTQKTEIIETWDGDPLQPIRNSTDAVSVALAEAYWLHWMAALTADSPPSFEIWVTPAGDWAVPAATPEFAVQSKSGSITALGPSPNNGGWWLMWAARSAAAAIANVPDGSTIELAARADGSDDEDRNPAIGRALYSGVVSDGRWNLREASPAISRATLADALDFMHALTVNREILFRNAAERDALENTAAIYSPEEGSLEWKDAAVRVVDNDERTLLMLATPVFRVRFGGQWPCDVEDEDDEDD
jgi:hypothetical protein